MEIKTTSESRIRPAASAAVKPGTKEKKSNIESNTTQNIDTFERSGANIFGDHMLTGSKDSLHLDGPIPSAGTLEYREPKEYDGFDWEVLEKDFLRNRQVTIENADSLRGSVDHMVSVYVAAKSTLEQRYGDQEDKLVEKMDRLNSLFDGAKKQMSASYGNTVGRFYENLGNKGAASSMSSSLTSAIDKRVEEMEELELSKKENPLSSNDSNDFYTLKQLSLEVWAFNQRAEGKLSENSTDENSSYSLKDLETAGIVAKAATAMNPGTLTPMSDEELGLFLASRYMKVAYLLEHSQTGGKMSDLILKSFGTYLNQYSGKALSGNGGAAKTYSYAIKQYESEHDIKQAVAKSAQTYLGHGFFSDFKNFGGNVSVTTATRYNFDIDQFLRDLENSGPKAILSSIAGTGIHRLSAYI